MRKEDRETLTANTPDELKAIHKQLKADGFKKSYGGYVERWTRHEWTKDPIKRVIYVEIEY